MYNRLGLCIIIWLHPGPRRTAPGPLRRWPKTLRAAPPGPSADGPGPHGGGGGSSAGGPRSLGGFGVRGFGVRYLILENDANEAMYGNLLLWTFICRDFAADGKTILPDVSDGVNGIKQLHTNELFVVVGIGCENLTIAVL